MADISELLANSDPEQLKKLLNMGNDLGSQAPYDAVEAAKDAQSADYGNLFGKQIAQDIVDNASVPGNTAADSASVFSKAIPEGIQEGQNLIPYTSGEIPQSVGSSLLGNTGKIISKAALPLSVAYELLKSTPANEGEDDIVASMKNKNNSSDNFQDVKDLMQNSSQLPDFSNGDKPSFEPDNSNENDDSDDSDDEDVESNRSPSSLKTLQDLRDKFTGKIPVESKMNSKDAIATLLGQRQAQLASAQNLQSNLQLLAGLEHAGETIGAGMVPLSKVKPDDAFYRTQMGMAQQPVENVMKQQGLESQAVKDMSMQQALQNEMAKNDETSDISALGRSLAKEAAQRAGINLDIPDNMSMANLEKIMPGIEGMANRQAMVDQRKATDALRLEIAKGTANTKADKAKIEERDKDEKIQERFGKDLNTLDKSKRTAIGAAASNIGSVNRLLQILEDPKATNQDLQNAYGDLAGVVQNGAPTMSGVEHQSYNTLQNKIAGVITNLTGEPTAPVIPEIKNHVKSVALKMNDVANDIINKHLGMVGSKYSGWVKRHPDETADMMNQAVQVTAPYVAPGSTSSQSSDQSHNEAIAWAKNPNSPGWTQAKAQAILKINGM